MRPPFPAARAPSTWGHWASGRAHAARERGQRGRGQSTDSRASTDRHAGGYTEAPRRPLRSRACVPGLWVPRPTFIPRPLSAQIPRPLPRQATGNAVPPPGRSIPEQMPCVSNLPRKGEWTRLLPVVPARPATEPDCAPHFPDSRGDAARTLVPSQGTRKFQEGTGLQTQSSSDGGWDSP